MIDPRRLALLAQVAATGTVTAAAAATGYTTSAVSQQLRRLRAEVGVDLLEPRGRTVVLTPAGRALVDRADDVLGAIERAEAAARSAAGDAAGPVRLGALASTLVDLVPRAMEALAASTDVELRVVHLGDELLTELRDRRIDLAVEHHWSSVAERDRSGLHAVDVLVEPVYVAVPRGVEVADRALVSRLAWVDHPCDQCGPAARSIIAAIGGDLDRRRFLTDDIAVMAHLAKLGAAATVIPGLACLHLPDGVDLWHVGGVERRIAAFVRDAGRADPRLAAVTGRLAAAGAELARSFEGLPVVGRVEVPAGGVGSADP